MDKTCHTIRNDLGFPLHHGFKSMDTQNPNLFKQVGERLSKK